MRSSALPSPSRSDPQPAVAEADLAGGSGEAVAADEVEAVGAARQFGGEPRDVEGVGPAVEIDDPVERVESARREAEDVRALAADEHVGPAASVEQVRAALAKQPVAAAAAQQPVGPRAALQPVRPLAAGEAVRA